MSNKASFTRRAALAVLAGPALLASGCAAPDSAATAIPRGTLAADDRTLAMQAAGAGLYEVEAGRLALARATGPALRDYGDMLVRHHLAAGVELQALLAAHGLPAPVRLPPQFDARLARLAAAQAEGFDTLFAQVAGVQDHEAQLAFFRHASQVARDPQLRDWFARNLPVLRQHLQAAQALPGAPGR
jgi:putative membrane protein